LRRQTGEPVEGRVTAPTEDAAYDVLGDHGIVAESLQPEPDTDEDTAAAETGPRLAQALQHALEEAGLHVSFDLVTGHYQGKSECLIDQENIRQRLAALVDDAGGDGHRDGENRLDARSLIAQLLEELRRNRRNLSAGQSPPPPGLEAQVNHLAEALARLERAMATMSVAARRARPGRPRTVATGQTAGDKTRDEVLIEIFQSNLELMRGLEEPAALPAAGGKQPVVSSD
jgi:hypothetical protein